MKLASSILASRFYRLWHDIQELQHPAVARHPLSWIGFAVWFPAVQQLGAWKLLKDVLVCGLRPGPPPHWDSQRTGKAGNRSPRPKKPKHPGKAERAVLHRRSRWGCMLNHSVYLSLSKFCWQLWFVCLNKTALSSLILLFLNILKVAMHL